MLDEWEVCLYAMIPSLSLSMIMVFIVKIYGQNFDEISNLPHGGHWQ